MDILSDINLTKNASLILNGADASTTLKFTGNKAFNQIQYDSTVSTTPSGNTALVTKKYVDDQINAVAHPVAFKSVYTPAATASSGKVTFNVAVDAAVKERFKTAANGAPVMQMIKASTRAVVAADISYCYSTGITVSFNTTSSSVAASEYMLNYIG